MQDEDRLPVPVPGRDMCSVLQEMRHMHKTRNYSALAGAIEELQTYANRMEAGLGNTRTTASLVRKALKKGDLDEAVRLLDKRYQWTRYELREAQADGDE